mgnify:CR=1 FL=1
MPDTHKDKLLGEAITHATELLTMLGEFYPFGVVEYPNGEIAYYAAQDDTEQEIIDLLVGTFSILAKKGEIIGAAVVVSVTIKTDEMPTDCILVQIVRTESEPTDYFAMYKMDGEKVTIVEVISNPGKRRIFS